MYNKPQSQEEQQKDRQHEQADGGQESEPQGVVNASKRSAEASRNASPPHPGYFNSDSIEIEHQKNKLVELADIRYEFDGCETVLANAGLRLGADGRSTTALGALKNGDQPLLTKKLYLHEVLCDGFPDAIRYLVGSRFTASSKGALLGIFGDIYIGEEPLTSDEYSALKFPRLCGVDGKPLEINAISCPLQRKYYIPADTALFAINEFVQEEVDAKQLKVTFTGRQRLSYDIAPLIDLWKSFCATQDCDFSQLKAEVIKRTKERYQQTSQVVSEEEYLKRYMWANIRSTIALHLEQLGLVSRIAGCAIGNGGTGSIYLGHVARASEIPPQGYQLTLRQNGVAKVTGNESVLHGRSSLVQQDARGIFVDEYHQEHSQISIGGSGLDDYERVERDSELHYHGAVLSEVCIATLRIAEKTKIDSLRPDGRMLEESHPLAKQQPELQGLYSPVTVVLDDTRRLADVLMQPADMLCVLLDQEQVEDPTCYSRVLEFMEQGSSNEAPLVTNAQTIETARKLLELRELYLNTIFCNMGRNVRAATLCKLSVAESALTLQNISCRGGLADSGDLIPSKQVIADLMTDQAVFGGVETLHQKPDVYSTTLFRKWLDDVLLTAYALGKDLQDLVVSPYSIGFIESYLGPDAKHCNIPKTLELMREALSEDLAVAKAADQPLSEEESIILEATKMVRNLYAVSRQFYCALPEEAHLLVKSGLLSVCLKYRMDIDSRLAGH